MAHKWWDEAVFYQIYPRSFFDTNGDGIGDIPGIITKLDYLKNLGVDAIWLSPVYKSPNVDVGYDISDYLDVNPEYGTLKDMRRLFKEARARNIRIVMDLVVNHTSDQHAWFQAARDKKSPYRDYYIWKKGKIDKKGRRLPPNNWDSMFTGSAWKYDEKSDEYYLHLFAEGQPDLNWRNPKIIEEVEKVMKFWLDMGASGFRCDVINVIWKDSFEDGVKKHYLTGLEHYLSTAGCHRILRRLNRDVLAPYDAYTVGETTHVTIEEAAKFTKDELVHVFPFDHTKVDQRSIPVFKKKYRPKNMIAALHKWQTQVEWTPLFFENHDIPRSVSRFGNDKRYHYESATMLATLLLTLKGTPYIYQGQEFGMKNVPFTKIEQMKDVTSHYLYSLIQSKYHLPAAIAFKLVMNVARDHARTPVAWKNTNQGGFTSGEPWMMLNPDFDVINLENAVQAPISITHFYFDLIKLRREKKALRIGDYLKLDSHPDVYAYLRTHQHERLLVACNMSGKKVKPGVDLTGKVLMSNYRVDDRKKLATLEPYQIVILAI